MMVQVQISKKQGISAEQAQLLRQVLKRSAQAALATICQEADADLSLVLGDDAQIRELNRTYRGVDAATDVLSFSSGEVDPETGRTYLGDILISYTMASSQAALGMHSVEAELQLLVVHGVLHLLGFDHDQPDQKTVMWGKQAEILKLLGCPISGPMEDL